MVDYQIFFFRSGQHQNLSVTQHFPFRGLKANEEAGVISMGVKYALLSFARNEEGMVEASFINGEQKYGKILVESTRGDKYITWNNGVCR